MKKGVLVLSILVGGLLLVNPNQKTIFAQNNNSNNKQKLIVQNNDKVNDKQNLVVQNNDKIDNKQVINTQTVLTQNEAQKLLVDYNNKVNYIFIGNASDFEALDEKGLDGYVFLPDVDSDMGYFVDKNTQHIYYFHPSGYFELIK